MPKLTTDCVQRINQALPLTEQLTLSQEHRGEYNCPFCGSTHHVEIYPDTNTAHCVHCGESFNGIQAYQQLRGVDFLTACREIAEDKLLRLEYEDGSVEYPDGTKETTRQNGHTATKRTAGEQPTVNQTKPPETANTAKKDEPPVPPEMKARIKQHIEQAAVNLFSDAGRVGLDYLHGRGMTDETIKTFHLGFSGSEYFNKAKKKGDDPYRAAIIFPHNSVLDYYSARAIDKKYFQKLDEKPKDWDTDGKLLYGGKSKLYNPAALYKQQPCFVAESALDSLSIIQSGGNSCALIGTAGDPLISQIEKRKPESVLILCLDNDEVNEQGRKPGQEGQAQLAAYLDEKEIPYIVADFDRSKYPQDVPLKDANDLLQADPAQLAADVKRIEHDAQRALKPDNVLDYIRNTMHDEIAEIVRDSGRGTGFSNLDAKLGGLYNGLYFIGGLSAVGKTSYMWQMCDGIAAQGYDCLFFSLEMSKLEMITKSIARYTVIMDPRNAATSSQIRRGKRSQAIEKAAIKYMRDVGDHISVIQGDFTCDVNSIADYIERYIQKTGKRPVCFVDYLQILPAALDTDTKRKATDPRVITNENVTRLKQLSRQHGIPIICAAALNRSNYLSPIDFESFRESSGIEYSADCVLGLQLTAIHDPIFDEEKKTIEKRERLQQARREIPRSIENVILKNRWGASGETCYYAYYPQYDYFVVPPEDEPDPADLNTWRHAADAEQQELDLIFD